MIALFVILITNFTFQLLWGERGLQAYDALQKYQGELVRHLEIQERVNLLMNDRLIRLQQDPSTLKEEAARLNYVEEKDLLIFIRGWEDRISSLPQEQLLRYTPEKQPDRSRIFRWISLLSGFLAFGVVLIWKRKEPGEEEGLNRIL